MINVNGNLSMLQKCFTNFHLIFDSYGKYPSRTITAEMHTCQMSVTVSKMSFFSPLA